MPPITIELPQISKNATPDQIRKEIPKLVAAKMKLESALRNTKKIMNDFDQVLRDEKLYTNPEDFQNLQEMIKMLKNIELS